jgi:hypothetical protein
LVKGFFHGQMVPVGAPLVEDDVMGSAGIPALPSVSP